MEAMHSTASQTDLGKHDPCVICVDHQCSRDFVHKDKVGKAEDHLPAQRLPIGGHLASVPLGTHTLPPAFLHEAAHIVQPAAKQAALLAALVEQRRVPGSDDACNRYRLQHRCGHNGGTGGDD
jgi:hypothetical protein